MPSTRCVIFNPTARGNKAVCFRRYLNQLRDCTLMATTGPGSARELAAFAVRSGYETIVAAGGDGTINEALNGIGDAPQGFERSQLAIMPLGTVNVFAREMNIPTELKGAWEIIEQGKTALIDLPEITYQTNGGEQHRYFIQMAGAGLDARAVELVNWSLKKKIGSLAYVWAGVLAISQRQTTIRVQTKAWSAQGEFVVVSNGKFYGGKFTFCPQADYADGILDVCVFPKVSWWLLPGYSLALLTNRLSGSGLTQLFQAKEFELKSEPPAPIQVDGEAVGYLPAKIRIHPKTLRIVIP